MSVEIENLRKDVRMRAETDSMMSSAWILIYIIPIFVAILFVLSFIFTIITAITTVSTTPPSGPPTAPPTIPPFFNVTTTTTTQLMPLMISIVFVYLLAIIALIAYVILIYKLVKRRNTHFKRQIFLFEDILATVKATAAKKGVNVEVGLASCERTVRETKAEETEKGAVLWAILSVFIPFADWYVRYFLMKNFYRHERREEGLWEDISRILDKCGITFSVPRRIKALPQRSFVLYLILTIITLGLFGIYWLYVLLNDPNEHFKYHIQIEDQLLSTLESVTV